MKQSHTCRIKQILGIGSGTSGIQRFMYRNINIKIRKLAKQLQIYAK